MRKGTEFSSSLTPRREGLWRWIVIGVVSTLAGLGLGAEALHLQVDSTPPPRISARFWSYADVVKRVAPSVVNIYTTRRVIEETQEPFLGDPFFWYFFGAPFGFESIPKERREQSLGSGVIVTPDGYILTNNHVIEGAEEIRVYFPHSRQTLPARVVGTDPATDIAVLKVEAHDLPAAVLGDSDKIEVGDVVLAIGNPFGVGQTVTVGIVSAKGRGGIGIADYEDFIQTDASINPGNSGGPLVDCDGRVIGINTAILSRSGGYQGIGFAVPINMARYVLEQIVKYGRVERGYLGLVFQDLTADLAEFFHVKTTNGVLVSEVKPGSPAEKVGIRAGDVIIRYDGETVTDSHQLRVLIGQTRPGTQVEVVFLRDGREHRVTVTLARFPLRRKAGLTVRRHWRQSSQPQLPPLAGVQIANLDIRYRYRFQIPSRIQGVVIVEVAPNTPAEEAGLQPGDVIQEINRIPIRSVTEAVQVARTIRGSKVLLRIWRDGVTRYIVVQSVPKVVGP